MKDRALAFLSAISFLIFVAIAAAVRMLPQLQSLDLQAALWFNNLSLGDTLNSVLVGASLYGREYFWISLVALMFLFGDRQTKMLALGLCGVFVVGVIAGEVAKDLVARARPWVYLAHLQSSQFNPPVMRIPFDTDFSFPSGHALIVSIGAIYSLITFRRKWVAGLLALEAAVVCVSRVYTFEHYPTDVLGGVLLGAAIAPAGVLVGRRYLLKWASAAADYLVRLFREGPLRL
ncbi:MAG: phosphatase PAP2 family protein [Thaumarchaeota archaeon]|nr:phosphatase PAP2 family protein [Nitrososphaerota archaeon]